MSTVLWAAVLLGAVWAAHWGAEHLADPLKKLRRQGGFSVAAGGSFIGLATASPSSTNPSSGRSRIVLVTGTAYAAEARKR